MQFRRIGALAFIIGVVAQVLQAVPALIVSNWFNNGIQIPQWAPTFGTAGQTVVVYQIVTEITGPAVTLALAIGLGYYVGKRLDLGSEYRRFIETVAVGSILGVLIPGIAVIWYGSSFRFDILGLFLILATFVQQFVQVALLIILGAFAGAALTHFQSQEKQPKQPVEAETASTTNHDDTATGTTDIQSQPTQ